MHPGDPLKINRVPFEFSVAGVTRMMFSFLQKTKRKIRVAEDFVLLDFKSMVEARPFLCMSISEHSNGLASTIDFKCNRKNKTKASATIIFLFIFLSKPNIILVSPATLHSYGTQLTFDGSSGCN